MQELEFLKPNTHRDGRHLKLLRQRTGDAIQDLVVSLGDIANMAPNPRERDEAIAQRSERLNDSRFPIREHVVPRRNDQPARHQQARRVEICLPFDWFFRLARTADDARHRRPIEQQSLSLVWNEQMTVKPPMSAPLVRESEPIAALLRRCLLGVRLSSMTIRRS
jgi:hypothetical protein